MLLNPSSAISRHGSIPLPWRTFLLGLIATGLYLLFGPAPETLVYNRTEIVNGEWWRLITAHWVHSDGQHALWDIGMLLLLGGVSERYLGRHIFSIMVAASLLLSICIWFFLPWLEYYCGLSGILHTLLAISMFTLWDKQRNLLFLLIIGATVLKTLVELNINTALVTNTAWPILSQSHLFGLFLGITFLAVDITWKFHQTHRPVF